MATLTANNWQQVFSFLDVDSADACCNVFVAAHDAFLSCVFIVLEMPRFKMHHFTNRELADKQFEKSKKASRIEEVQLLNAKSKVLKVYKE